jgi:hypothetical protein
MISGLKLSSKLFITVNKRYIWIYLLLLYYSVNRISFLNMKTNYVGSNLTNIVIIMAQHHITRLQIQTKKNTKTKKQPQDSYLVNSKKTSQFNIV